VVERAMTGALAAFDDRTGVDSDPMERLTLITGRMLQGLIIHPEYMLVFDPISSTKIPRPKSANYWRVLGQQLTRTWSG